MAFDPSVFHKPRIVHQHAAQIDAADHQVCGAALDQKLNAVDEIEAAKRVDDRIDSIALLFGVH